MFLVFLFSCYWEVCTALGRWQRRSISKSPPFFFGNVILYLHVWCVCVCLPACVYLLHAASLMSFSSGTVVAGWTPSATNRWPFGDGGDLALWSAEQESWIVSTYVIGALFGALPAGHLSQTYGRKAFLLYLSVPMTIGWIVCLLKLNSVSTARIDRVRVATGPVGQTTRESFKPDLWGGERVDVLSAGAVDGVRTLLSVCQVQEAVNIIKYVYFVQRRAKRSGVISACSGHTESQNNRGDLESVEFDIFLWTVDRLDL